jgi:hypothetical protein
LLNTLALGRSHGQKGELTWSLDNIMNTVWYVLIATKQVLHASLLTVKISPHILFRDSFQLCDLFEPEKKGTNQRWKDCSIVHRV